MYICTNLCSMHKGCGLGRKVFNLRKSYYEFLQVTLAILRESEFMTTKSQNHFQITYALKSAAPVAARVASLLSVALQTAPLCPSNVPTQSPVSPWRSMGLPSSCKNKYSALWVYDMDCKTLFLMFRLEYQWHSYYYFLNVNIISLVIVNSIVAFVYRRILKVMAPRK